MTETPELTEQELEGAVEALLFSSPEPIPPAKLAETCGVPLEAVRGALNRLMLRYQGGGFQLAEVAAGYRFETNPAYAKYVALMQANLPAKITRAQLETLAIIAYNQPVTGPEIDHMRGVTSDYVISALMQRGLVHAVGRKEGPGRPVMYATTKAFLDQFGLRSPEDLPPLEAVAIEETLAEPEVGPLLRYDGNGDEQEMVRVGSAPQVSQNGREAEPEG
jgi:segregation and condensation protein B